MIKKSIYNTHFSWLKSCFLHSAIKLYIILHHKVELYDRFGQIQSHHERFENNNVGGNMFDVKKGLQKLQKSPIVPFTRWFISTRSSFFSSATNHILNWPFSNVKILRRRRTTSIQNERLQSKVEPFKQICYAYIKKCCIAIVSSPLIWPLPVWFIWVS